MPVYRSRSGESISKPSQRKTVALPFEEPQDALVLPYILSEVYSSLQDDENALELNGLPHDAAAIPTHIAIEHTTIDADVDAIVSGVATMTATTTVQRAIRPVSPRAHSQRRGARSGSSSTSSSYLSRTGNNILGHLLGAVSPPLSPTHGRPITTVNFG